MCQHITKIAHCNHCKAKIYTEEFTCSAAWYKRIVRQHCDNTDWSAVQDYSTDKLCQPCASIPKRPTNYPYIHPSRLIIPETPAGPSSETVSPVSDSDVREPVSPLTPTLEVEAVKGPLSEYNNSTAPPVHAKLNNFLARNPHREGVPESQKARLGDLMAAMNGFEFVDVLRGQQGSSSSRGTESSRRDSTSSWEKVGHGPTNPVNIPIANDLTQSPEKICEFCFGRHKKTTGARTWTCDEEEASRCFSNRPWDNWEINGSQSYQPPARHIPHLPAAVAARQNGARGSTDDISWIVQSLYEDEMHWQLN